MGISSIPSFRLQNDARFLKLVLECRHGFLSPTCAISDAVASFSDSSVLPPSRSIMLVSNLSWPNSRLLTNRLRTLAISGSPSERAASAETLISVSLYSGDGVLAGDAQRGIDGHVRQLQLNARHTPGTPGASNQHQVTRRSTSKSLSYLGICGASLCKNWTHNPLVLGSNPSGPSHFPLRNRLAELVLEARSGAPGNHTADRASTQHTCLSRNL